MRRGIEPWQADNLAVRERSNVEIRGAIDALSRRMSVELGSSILPGSREAEIGLTTPECVARDHETRTTLTVGPDIPVPAGIVVQQRAGRERSLAGNATMIPGIAADRGQ